MAPTPEQAQQLMRHLSDLQQAYAGGGRGLPPGQEWIDWAMQYLEQEEAQNPDVYGSREAVEAALEQWQLLQDAPPPAPPPPSFREAMDLPEWWASFQQFAASEYSSENPNFLDAIRYQTMTPRDIYDHFVGARAEEMVNLSSAVKAPLDEAFAGDGDPGYDVFAGAYEAIIGMMSVDTWRRFLAQDGH